MGYLKPTRLAFLFDPRKPKKWAPLKEDSFKQVFGSISGFWFHSNLASKPTNNKKKLFSSFPVRL